MQSTGAMYMGLMFGYGYRFVMAVARGVTSVRAVWVWARMMREAAKKDR